MNFFDVLLARYLGGGGGGGSKAKELFNVTISYGDLVNNEYTLDKSYEIIADEFYSFSISDGSDTYTYYGVGYAVEGLGEWVDFYDGDNLICSVSTGEGVTRIYFDYFPEESTISVTFTDCGRTLVVGENGTYDVAEYGGVLVDMVQPQGDKTIYENGIYDVTSYETVDVQTPVPNGTTNIYANGTHDVSYFEYANVSVSLADLVNGSITVHNASSTSSVHCLFCAAKPVQPNYEWKVAQDSLYVTTNGQLTNSYAASSQTLTFSASAISSKVQIDTTRTTGLDLATIHYYSDGSNTILTVNMTGDVADIYADVVPV